MNFNQILEKYRKIAFSERDKGDRFERLMQAYLQTDPIYSNKFNYVWLWNEFPSKMDFGGKDVGIDLVARTFDGDYWAIQCKCYREDSSIDKKSVDSVLFTFLKSNRQRRNCVKNIQKLFDSQFVRDNNINLHTFRHTYAHTMLNKGVNKVVLKTLLGHRSFNTTEIYANWVIKEELEKWV